MKLILMVTGLKTIQKNSSLNKKSSKALSIQISLSGLSFCILNKKNNSVGFLKSVTFPKKQTPYTVLEQLKTVLNTNTIFEQPFDEVQLIHENELSSIVPKPLFDENNVADYLKFNAKILNTDFVAFDEITDHNSVVVFVPYVNINNYIFDRFGEFIYKHASSILVKTILDKEVGSNDTKFYVHIGNDHFEIIVIKKGHLVFYNTFEYLSKEDFIYFILFTLEQLQLDPETVQIKLLGSIKKDDELYEIAYKYVRHVDIVGNVYDFEFGNKPQPEELQNSFIILNSFN
ncbi:uncharacterized protein DUF3822 [Flavobacteriaceae bacterium MAR_2010_105]|nr:uncharacterized protein DUF3822 [Flavobacteriaceae bacterium MAR_2010_105]